MTDDPPRDPPVTRPELIASRHDMEIGRALMLSESGEGDAWLLSTEYVSAQRKA